jgi:PDZ domain-containing protein
MRYSPLPRFVKFVLFTLLGTALLAPLPFVIVLPGPATDVLGPVVKVSSQFTDQVSAPTGKLMLTTVSISSPNARVSGIEVIFRWFQSAGVVVPRSVVYEENVDANVEAHRSLAQMGDSQANASIAALNYLNANEPKLVKYLQNGELSSKNIKFYLQNTGGPSGGLIFALGIIEKLNSAQLVKGRLIAGTGTITQKGDIGPIGGIEDKLIGAKRAGATLFLAPIDNCADISHIPNGLQVIAVATLSDAVKFLKAPTLKLNRLPQLSGCFN